MEDLLTAEERSWLMHIGLQMVVCTWMMTKCGPLMHLVSVWALLWYGVVALTWCFDASHQTTKPHQTPSVGRDMHQVMTHELGHNLGLSHSQDRDAVMFAYFRYRSNFKLAQDDVEGIQYLYGWLLTCVIVMCHVFILLERFFYETTPTLHRS